MAADKQGNDLSKVGIPVTGGVAVQLDGTPVFLTPEEGKKTPLQVPAAYTYIGLITEDGGPEETAEGGDAIKFWQDGYTLTGSDTLKVAVELAEMNPTVQNLITGKTPDANGCIKIDSAHSNKKYPLFVGIEYKNGMQRRMNGMASIESVEVGQSSRGEVTGRKVTFTWEREPAIGNAYYLEWWINADGTPMTKETTPVSGGASSSTGSNPTGS
ncbi:hypothetical protein [Mobiluncus curtisii]|uniref:hypothetical protein n=1 Tax=Mobiluncus curtisii TaxID=2051 RepID=UPI00147019E1|nr:hypothetical protein [Mobiluncus curtisii]NMW88051.1 hypothetical protein [Mobiluncus curtisii]